MAPRSESRVKRLTRWLDNARILEEVYFLPYVDILLTQLAIKTLVVVMDGSVVGRGCLALMLHVVYKGRALPLAWRVRQSPKGHCPEDLHIALVELLSTVIPEGARWFFWATASSMARRFRTGYARWVGPMAAVRP